MKLATKAIMEALRAELLASPVQSLVASRIYPGLAQQDARRPYVVYHVIFGTPSLTHDGDASQTEIGVQFDLYADTISAVVGVADAMRNALLGVDWQRDSIRFQFCGIDDEDSIFGADEETANLKHWRMDFRFIATLA